MGKMKELQINLEEMKMSHEGNDAIIDAQRDELPEESPRSLAEWVTWETEPLTPILMLGSCNRCDKKIFVRSVADGERKTGRNPDHHPATGHDPHCYGLFVFGEWRFILSTCCNGRIRRTTETPHWTSETKISLTQGNTYPH